MGVSGFCLTAMWIPWWWSGGGAFLEWRLLLVRVKVLGLGLGPFRLLCLLYNLGFDPWVFGLRPSLAGFVPMGFLIGSLPIVCFGFGSWFGRLVLVALPCPY